MPLIKHFTNAEYLSSIYADSVLKLEGSNIEYVIRNNIEAIHPSGLPIKILWKAMKVQYKLAGRYVWLTEETDVNCITAQRKFEKIAFVFDAEENWGPALDGRCKTNCIQEQKSRQVN